MNIEVRNLIAKNKFEGKFNFEYDPPQDICLVPLCSIKAVRVEGEFEIYDDDSVGVRFTVNYTLSGQCSYCLASAEKQISYETEILYLIEDDGENYNYDGKIINLDKAVDDAILMSQPNILLCKEDCKGIDVT